MSYTLLWHFYMADMMDKMKNNGGCLTNNFKSHASLTQFRYSIPVNFCTTIFSSGLGTCPGIDNWGHFVPRSSDSDGNIEDDVA
jgi:hypothetical protein